MNELIRMAIANMFPKRSQSDNEMALDLTGGADLPQAQDAGLEGQGDPDYEAISQMVDMINQGGQPILPDEQSPAMDELSGLQEMGADELSPEFNLEIGEGTITGREPGGSSLETYPGGTQGMLSNLAEQAPSDPGDLEGFMSDPMVMDTIRQILQMQRKGG